MAERVDSARSRISNDDLKKTGSGIGEEKKDTPCTACTLQRCRSNSLSSSCGSSCGPCSFKPDTTCNMAAIMRPALSSYSPTPSCCPRSPLCGSRCPPPPICCPPPRISLPPRCFRCCEVTSKPIFSCDPCKPLCDPCPPSSCCPPPKCDPCAPKCDPCAPKCDPCAPKCDPCAPKPSCPPPPCSPPPCETPKKEEEKETPIARTPRKETTPPPTPKNPCPPSPPMPHCCPSDVELERAKGFIENITGDTTWKKYGVRIQFTDPISPGTSSVKVGNPLTVRLGVEVKASSCLSPDVISAYMWTHMKTQCNPCGTWKDLPLHFKPEETTVGECGVKRYVYSSTLTPVDTDTYRLTFNIKWGNHMIWANNYGADNMVGVAY